MSLLTRIFDWFTELFNPPLRSAMSFRQKIGRIALITTTLTTISTLVALELALILYAAHAVVTVPYLADVAEILAVSIVVNALCVLVLLKIKRLDQHLMQTPEQPPLAAKK